MSLVCQLKHFVSHNRIITSLIIGIPVILLSRPIELSILIGLPIVFFGEFVRIFSSGYLEKDSRLSVGGPYSVTRNPLYTGNFLIGLGFAIAVNHLAILFFFLAFFIFIYSATVEEEEKRLYQRFGEAFLAYKESVPKFIPHLWKWKGNGQYFRWFLVMKHREYITWFGIIGGILFLAVKMTFL